MNNLLRRMIARRRLIQKQKRREESDLMFSMAADVVKEWQKSGDFKRENLTELAAKSGVGIEYIREYVTITKNMSARSWVIQLRIAEAKKILALHPEKSINWVAMMCGFNDRSNFSKQFKRITGFRPMEWKEQFK